LVIEADRDPLSPATFFQCFLNYFVDLNENQACEITPDDAVWRLDIGAAQGHLDVALSYHEGFANLGCSGFP